MGKKRRLEIEALPGKNIWFQNKEVPKYGMIEWVKIGPETYRSVVKTREQWVRLTPTIVKEMGLGIPYRCLIQLINAKFVEGQKASPGVWLFSLDSYAEHLQKCKADPYFWDKDHPDKNYERYMAAVE